MTPTPQKFVDELKRGLKALRLECPEAVCADLEKLVWAAYDETIKDTTFEMLKQLSEIKARHALALQTSHDEGVREEREACAKMAEEGVDVQHPTVKDHIMKNWGADPHIAQAIRQRGSM